MDITITNNRDANRFETKINGRFAYLEYRSYTGGMALMHTFVPEEDRNQGIAFALAKFALEYAQSLQLKLIVYCTTIKKYLELHPDYEKLLEIRYHI